MSVFKSIYGVVKGNRDAFISFLKRNGNKLEIPKGEYIVIVDTLGKDTHSTTALVSALRLVTNEEGKEELQFLDHDKWLNMNLLPLSTENFIYLELESRGYVS